MTIIETVRNESAAVRVHVAEHIHDDNHSTWDVEVNGEPINREPLTSEPRDDQVRALVLGYTFVNMSGGVIQHDEVSAGIESFFIDWDEVGERREYAQEKWEEVNALVRVPANLVKDVRTGLLDGYPDLDETEGRSTT